MAQIYIFDDGVNISSPIYSPKSLLKINSVSENIDFTSFTFTDSFVKKIVYSNLDILIEWLDSVKKLGIIIPFTFFNIFNRLTLYNNKECNEPHAYERAKLMFEYVKENQIIKDKPLQIPKIQYISNDIKKVKLAFELLDFYFPDTSDWSNVHGLTRDKYRTNSTTDYINEFLDSKRDKNEVDSTIKIMKCNDTHCIIECIDYSSDDDSDGETIFKIT